MLYPNIPHQHRSTFLLIIPSQIPDFQYGPSTPFLLSYTHQDTSSFFKSDSSSIRFPCGERTLGREMTIYK
jgi:hypothetical protein